MDDLISRAVAIDYFVTNVGFHDEDGYPIEDSDELRKIWTEYFDGIPSAQSKPGKWLYTRDSVQGKIYVCSECGQRCLEHTTLVLQWKYCPSCGTKMEKRN